MLRPHQQKAIDYSVENDFESGVYFHATGTGKSWIALQLVMEYQKRNSYVIFYGSVNKKLFWLNNFFLLIFGVKGFKIFLRLL
jgi:predicted helicase